MNIAQAVSRFAHTAAADGVKPSLVQAWKCARENGGRARTSGSNLLGYRFPDGSAVTADCVEFLGTFKGERGYSETPTPITDAQLASAVERAQQLADLTFARKIPFLGVHGAAGASCFSDGVMSKVCGLEYVRLIQVYTGHTVPCDAYGFLVTEPSK